MRRAHPTTFRTSGLDLDLIPALCAAPHDGSLQLVFQPQLDLATGTVVGMEALLRWKHPDRGVLRPDVVLPLAEHVGAMPALEGWVLDAAVDEAARWARIDGPPRQLWVNMSRASLTDPHFLVDVADRVGGAGLPRGTLGIEVTEEAVLALEAQQVGTAASVLAELREIGCATAVDDFGSWYSSLASLEQLPLDAVKIDRNMVRGLAADTEEGDIVVSAVVRLAHRHGLLVVAEGVESWAEGSRLLEVGVDRAHGYLFSAPLPPGQARWMLVKGGGYCGSPPPVPTPRAPEPAGTRAARPNGTGS